MKLKTILLGSGCVVVNAILIKNNIDKKKRINKLRGGEEITGQVIDEKTTFSLSGKASEIYVVNAPRRDSDANVAMRKINKKKKVLLGLNIAAASVHFVSFASQLYLYFSKDKTWNFKIDSVNKIQTPHHIFDIKGDDSITDDFDNIDKLYNNIGNSVDNNLIKYYELLDRIKYKKKTIIKSPYALLVASFSFICFLAHVTLIILKDRYNKWILVDGVNRARWFEYSVSSGIMMASITLFAGTTNWKKVLNVFLNGSVTNLFGLGTETTQKKNKSISFILFLGGFIPFISSWLEPLDTYNKETSYLKRQKNTGLSVFLNKSIVGALHNIKELEKKSGKENIEILSTKLIKEIATGTVNVKEVKKLLESAGFDEKIVKLVNNYILFQEIINDPEKNPFNKIPDFVVYIVYILFAIYLLFPLNMGMQKWGYKLISKNIDSEYYGEIGFLLLSLISKVVLSWIVFFGINKRDGPPEEVNDRLASISNKDKDDFGKDESFNLDGKYYYGFWIVLTIICLSLGVIYRQDNK